MKAWLKSAKGFLADQNWISLTVLVVIVLCISTPIYYRRILVPPADTDYGAHILFTQQMLEGGQVSLAGLSHPLLHLAVGFIYWASRCQIGFWEGMIIVLVAAQMATALIFYFWLGRLAGKFGQVGRVLWSVTLTLVAPIFLLVPVDGAYYYGYIGLANYHNPTIHLLRPLALLSFILLLRIFEKDRSSWGWVALSAVVMIFAALAKPNYTLSILPALACMAVIRLGLRQSLDWRMLVWGGLAPGVLVLAGQSGLMYLTPTPESSGIVFAPWVVESAFSDFLPWKFLLSIAFPLVLWVVSARTMLRRPEMQLAWIAFLGGAAQMYLFAESGYRDLHGNFRWSAQITLFLLFAASIRWFVHNLPVGWKQRLPVWAAYLAHLAAGIVYYVYCLVQAKYG